MDGQKQQISDSIKQANNILVTVSANPSVDQLAACISLTLALNKLKKHATAVFSGDVPSTIEFLQPEKTLEKNTDSLRDFIISLDKSKADKLRYKIEDKVVKIFITPYRTSIGEKDLEFSEGDFNVDVVLALGVHNQGDLDQAITAHGRILHDATVMAINVTPGSEVGSMNLLDTQASSLSEVAVDLLDIMDKRLIDNQIATALLTGIISETGRFRNNKTTPKTMSVAAELLSAGANQQLVASKLETPPPPPPPPPTPPPSPTIDHSSDNQNGGDHKEDSDKDAKPGDGTLEIQHEDANVLPELKDNPEPPPPPPPPPMPEPEEPEEIPKAPQIHIDDNGEVSPLEDKKPDDDEGLVLPPLPPPPKPRSESPRMLLQPPTFNSQMSADSSPAGSSTDEQPGGSGAQDMLSLPQVESQTPMLDRTPIQSPVFAPPVSPPPVENNPLPPINSVNALSQTPAIGPFAPDANMPNSPLPSLPPIPQSGPLPPLGSMPPPPPPPANNPLPPLGNQSLPPIPQSGPLPPLGSSPALSPEETLSDIEREVRSPHLTAMTPPPPPANNPLPPLGNQSLPPIPQSSALPPLNSAPPLPPLPPLPPPPVAEVLPPQVSGTPSESEMVQNKLDVASARDAVDSAISGSSDGAVEPIQSLNAQNLGAPLHDDDLKIDDNGSIGAPDMPPIIPPTDNTLPPLPPLDSSSISGMGGSDPNAPPPVPPPMIPPMPSYSS